MFSFFITIHISFVFVDSNGCTTFITQNLTHAHKTLWDGVAQSVERLATGWTIRGIEDFPHVSRPALGPTHPPVQ